MVKTTDEWFPAVTWKHTVPGDEIKLVSNSGTQVIGKVEENTENYLRVDELLFPKHEKGWTLYTRTLQKAEVPETFGTVFSVVQNGKITETYFTLNFEDEKYYALVAVENDEAPRDRHMLRTREEILFCVDSGTEIIVCSTFETVTSVPEMKISAGTAFTVDEIEEMLTVDSDADNALSLKHEDGYFWFSKEEFMSLLTAKTKKR